MSVTLAGRPPRANLAGTAFEPVALGVARLTTLFVNLYAVDTPQNGWVLVDAGLPGFAGSIREAVRGRYGPGSRPSAIVLTHGHFDHVGPLQELAEGWDIPVFAHRLEQPYLTGRSPYPPPDPTVGGGMMASLSWMYPRGPIDLGVRSRVLPEDGSIPMMPGWRWIHTPGHTPGHVSLFRESDRTLLAGDAFVTTKQESALAALEQRLEIHGPPAYYTSDWTAARRSVEALAGLEPALAATGHGRPLGGESLRSGLQALARDFDQVAIPARGRYVDRPATSDENGVLLVPPERPGPPAGLAVGIGVGLLAGLALRSLAKDRRI